MDWMYLSLNEFSWSIIISNSTRVVPEEVAVKRATGKGTQM